VVPRFDEPVAVVVRYLVIAWLRSLLPPLQYRTIKNYKSPEYLGPRVGDKLVFA
jgi:hypothetical protein